jgi:hypothetical protein
VLVDLVEDRVISRTLTVTLFMVVFAFVLRALYVVFLLDPIVIDTSPPSDLQLLGSADQGSHSLAIIPHNSFM